MKSTSIAAPDWVRVNEQAPWQARDSQTELVFDDKLWILGGWFNSMLPAPRDVWSSPDGKAWQCVLAEAPWKHSDLAMAVVFRGRMWVMGGWYNGRLEGHEAGNEVWSSVDGVKWDQATANAGWSPRLASGAVAFRGRMWILGGTENYFFGSDDDLRNDVWSSADGEHWDCVTEHAPWSPRAYLKAVVHDGKMWVFAGGQYVQDHHAKNDVWCSEDGVNWELVADNAPWGARLWFRTAVYRDHMWVLGGWSKAQDNFGDVWCSRDGQSWVELKSNVIWKSRHEHAVYVFNDKLWVAGGHARPLSSEVWSLDMPQGWLEQHGA
jgi:hypothetical protein